jgi:hypothetical protein
VSAYVGDGANLGPRFTIPHASTGSRSNAARVARPTMRLPRKACLIAIAEAIGRQLGLPVRSLTPKEADAHFGPLATWVANNGPASNEWTMKVLGGIVADIERPDYSR